jgi:hypothetical protein
LDEAELVALMEVEIEGRLIDNVLAEDYSIACKEIQ